MKGPELIDKAKSYAAVKHMHQTYGDGSAFIGHPAKVAATLREWGYGAEFVAAGWLHDVVEDTPVTVGEIEHLFGGRVALLVAHLTVAGRDKEEKLRDAMAKVQQYPMAAPVRLADRLANVRACLPGDRYAARYIGEHDTFEATVRPLVGVDCWRDYALAMHKLREQTGLLRAPLDGAVNPA